MTYIQEKLFTLLCEVDDICRKHDITYYLAAGCALGAVRHGGFLPWDDDVDVYITRDNWDKLRTVIYDELPDNRNFVCEEDTELYDNPIGRYVDKDTTQMMTSQIICGECCGLVLEFFIMDPMPVDEKGQEDHRRYMRLYTDLLSPYFVLAKKIYTQNRDYDYDLYLKYRKMIESKGRREVLDEIKGRFACFPEEGAKKYCMRWGQKTWVFDAKHFGPPSYMSFENRDFPILNYPREYFRSGYGDDWMYVPAGVDQISHDLSKDLDRPYQEYVDIYMPILDRDEVYKAYQDRKDKIMKTLLQRESLYYDLNMFKASTLGELMKENLPDDVELKNCLTKGDFDPIREQLQQYYEKQFDKDIMEDFAYIDLGDDFLSIAMEDLISKGLYYRAAKILECRKHSSDEPLSESVNEAAKHIDFCRKLSTATIDKADSETVNKILSEHPEYEGTLEYRLAGLWLMRTDYRDEKDLHSIIEQADEAIGSLGENGEIMSYRAWALHMLGDERAASEYRKAAAGTRNGFVWKEAKELYGIEIYEN